MVLESDRPEFSDRPKFKSSSSRDELCDIGQVPHLSEPQFPPLQHGDDNI